VLPVCSAVIMPIVRWTAVSFIFFVWRVLRERNESSRVVVGGASRFLSLFSQLL
jgi:hypothetical protein